jgi:hypothetical protein
MPSGIKKSFTPAPFWGDYRRHVPPHIKIPLSGSDRKAQAKGFRYRSDVHSHRIRIPKRLQPSVSQFVRASM